MLLVATQMETSSRGILAELRDLFCPSSIWTRLRLGTEPSMVMLTIPLSFILAFLERGTQLWSPQMTVEWPFHIWLPEAQAPWGEL